MERLLTISEVAGLASATQGQVKYALAAGDIAEPAGRLGPNGARVWTVAEAWAVKEHFLAVAKDLHRAGRKPKARRYPLPPLGLEPQPA
jgi:hypothetical protein